jgi:transposase
MTLEERAGAVALFRHGKSISEIADHYEVARSTIQRLLKKYNEYRVVTDLKRSIRKRGYSQRLERQIVQWVNRGQVSTVDEISRLLRNTDLGNLSHTTIRRILTRHGLVARLKKKKPFLTKNNMKARLQFAKAHQHWSVADWKKVIFSDETKLEIFQTRRREWTWRRRNERLRLEKIQPTFKHGGGSLMIWACITAYGVGYMCRLHGGLDSILFVQILDDEFAKTLEYYSTRQGFVLQQDNSPIHKARIVSEWLGDHDQDTLEFPSYSPDLNLIENVWNELKRRLHARNDIWSVETLWKAVQEEWEKLPPDYLARLYRSMPERIQDVIRSKGAHTDW